MKCLEQIHPQMGLIVMKSKGNQFLVFELTYWQKIPL